MIVRYTQELIETFLCIQESRFAKKSLTMSHVYLFFILSVGLAICNPVSDENSNENVTELKATETGIDNMDGDTCKPPCSLKDAVAASESKESESQSVPDTEENGHASFIMPAYHTDESDSLKSMGIGVSNFRGALCPHVHPKLFAMYNPGYNVNYLPPVQSTYIHGLIPQEDLQRANYELDIFNSPMLEQVRTPRMIHSQDEEILTELQHDAIMNNILPTMSVPMPRYAVAPASLPVAYSQGHAIGGAPAIAVFPYGSGGGCAQPILLSCSPKITRGTLQPIAPIDSGIVTSSAASYYRQPSDHISKSVDNKQNSTTNINSSKFQDKSNK